MNIPDASDPRALAHRLTTVGHALHDRLFAQLHERGIHPKTLLLLSAVDGRVDAPWVADRLARGGKRVGALADRGWITRSGDGWSLTDEGRALLDGVDAERSALLADISPDHITHLTAALDALAVALGVDEAAADGPRGGFRVIPGAGRRGFGPDPRRAFGPNEHRGFRMGDRPGPRRPFDPAQPPAAQPPAGPAAPAHDHGDRDGDGLGHRHGQHGQHGQHGHDEHGDRDAGHGHGEHAHHRGPHEQGCGHRPHRRRSEERAFERGFDAGFQRGREAGSPPASAD